MLHSQEHCNSPGGGGGGGGGGKSHVCTKCGWNYPNPHPSSKTRRAHKKICGTIPGFELFDSQKVNQILDLKEEEHCLDDGPKPPSPRVLVEKADERIGDISEEDVFTDAVSEFSRSDSFKESATNCTAKSTKNLSETQQCNSSPTGCVMESSEVVQDNCQVPPVEALENYDIPSSVEAAFDNRKGGESSTEGHSRASEFLIESSREAQIIDGGDTISNIGLETECKGNLLDEAESKLASALGKREDTSDSSWNDEVIYSDVKDPHGYALEEASSMTHAREAGCIVSENAPVDTSPVKSNSAQVISTSRSVQDDMPSVENTDVSWQLIKGLEEYEANDSVNLCFSETPNKDTCEADTLTQAENLIQTEGLNKDTEAPLSDKLALEDKMEPQGKSHLVTIKEVSITENITKSKIDPENIEMKADKGESLFGAAQETVKSETLRVSLPAVGPIIVDSNADVSRAANKTEVVDLVGHESELIQANVVAEEGNSPNSKLSSVSSCAAENYISPVSVVFEGDNASDQRKSLTETSKDSVLQFGAEACERNDETHREGGLVEESSIITLKNALELPISHSGSTGAAPDDTVETAYQKSLESGRTEFHRVVGGLGVIQATEIDSYIKAPNFYAEVPVTIESNDHRDIGRLQNPSEAHIRSLVSSPLVTRNNPSNALESNFGSVSGLSVEVYKPENTSENQEIIMEKTTSWSTSKEHHVPLKNLLSEARSPKLQQEAKGHNVNSIPRVSSILGQATSPEDSRLPERREVSEEWNSPAKYPVDLKREERKVKGRPFWVPFVCCSSVK